jgi:hypothetical protein
MVHRAPTDQRHTATPFFCFFVRRPELLSRGFVQTFDDSLVISKCRILLMNQHITAIAIYRPAAEVLNDQIRHHFSGLLTQNSHHLSSIRLVSIITHGMKDL